MKKLLGYILTPIFYFVFGLILCVFHVAQVIALRIFGKNAHKKTVDVMNFCLLYSLWILGTRIHIKYKFKPPVDKPIIFVANHQSLYDIVGIIWFLRNNYPKFVSKIELGKGIPSISYNLRHSGAAMINRNDPRQAITAIAKLGKLIEENNYSAVIFPEGTRSKDGTVKGFAAAGINALLKKAPDALVVPIVINNNWKLNRWRFPMSVGEHISWTVLPCIQTTGKEIATIVLEAENAIRAELSNI
ncbi:lysophospholipid acyltransferase family protein [Pinibacter soli]|uniref:Lysophospholipid acyltransferase family protein n=1 Tax=Pinibacter soli TaxID=3044211 RepID=A0ABT6RHR4_9BACT|nr:lysophospholipid acyltransferase family protein [Pinibacter soli]MDI3322114.1 lysophospholipid acyltransferase family protein [Pinibacter soli]